MPVPKDHPSSIFDMYVCQTDVFFDDIDSLGVRQGLVCNAYRDRYMTCLQCCDTHSGMTMVV